MTKHFTCPSSGCGNRCNQNHLVAHCPDDLLDVSDFDASDSHRCENCRCTISTTVDDAADAAAAAYINKCGIPAACSADGIKIIGDPYDSNDDAFYGHGGAGFADLSAACAPYGSDYITPSYADIGGHRYYRAYDYPRRGRYYAIVHGEIFDRSFIAPRPRYRIFQCNKCRRRFCYDCCFKR